MPLPRPPRRWAMRGLAAVAGCLPALAFPGVGAWWLGWVGFVPLLLLFAGAGSYREAAWRSVLAAAGFFLTYLNWVLPHAGILAVVIGVVAGIAWLPFGLAAYRLLREPSARGVALAVAVLPSVWVVVEVLRSREELGGPWALAGLSQWQVPPVLEVVSLGGVWLLSFVLIAVNVGLAAAALPRAGRATRLTGAGLAVGVAVLAVGYGLVRPDPTPTGSVRIAAVQAGVVHDGEARFDAHLDLTRRAEGRGQVAVVWGQSSVPFDPRRRPGTEAALRSAAEAVGSDLLVNVDARGTDGRIRKTTQQYGPAGLSGEYEKRRLVPFGEYVPMRGLLGGILGGTSVADEDRAPGGEPVILTAGGVRLGPLISYESIFPDLRRELVRLGADVTVVQGSLTSFHGTWAQPQQASAEAVRAVETGRSAVLVEMNGPTVAFDARGEQLAWLPPQLRGLVVVDVPRYDGRTPYVRWGDWLPVLAGVATALAVVVPLSRTLVRRVQS